MAYIRGQGGVFSVKDPSGMTKVVTDPVVLHDLYSGKIPSVEDTSYSAGSTTPAVSGGASVPDSAPVNDQSDPALFNSTVVKLLDDAKNRTNAVNAVVSGQKNKLTNESLNLSNPLSSTPYSDLFKGLDASQTVSGMEGTEAAFQPGITSLNEQQAQNNKALENDLALYHEAYKPEVMAPGQSLVTPGGQTLTRTPNYGAPTLRPDTGTLDSFDSANGMWKSDEEKMGGTGLPGQGGHATPTAPAPSEFEAIFGKSNPIGAYATDPNYVTSMNGQYKSLSSDVKSLGYDQNPALALDQYIKNNHGSSSINGSMIKTAADTYGLDPILLASVMMHESDFGTEGQAGKNNNPGGIIWANQPGASQGTARPANEGGYYARFNSWNQGVMAVANNLANRVKAASSAPTGQGQAPASSAVGGAFSTEASQKVSSLPAPFQRYADAGPMGVAYINTDRINDLSPEMKQGIQMFAAKAGIPVVQPGDVGALKSITAVLTSLDNMTTLANKNLAGSSMGSPLGHFFDATLGRVNMMAQSEWGNQLSLFNNYRDTAIKAVQALAGGAGSGLRINGAEIAANTQNLPEATDSQPNALTKIQQLRQLIYTQLATTFPYAMVPMVDTKGNPINMPAGNLAEALKAGAKIE